MPDQTTKEKTPPKQRKGRSQPDEQVWLHLTNNAKGDIPDAATGRTWIDARGLLAPSWHNPNASSTGLKTLFQVQSTPQYTPTGPSMGI